jgi:hypothetical protein
MIVLFAISATVVFQVGICLFCFYAKQVETSGKRLQAI